MSRTDSAHALPRRVVDVLLFEPFDAAACSLQSHLLLRDDVHVAGVAPSASLLGALAHIAPPDVVLAHNADPFALARTLPELRAELPRATLVAVYHGTASTTPAMLRLAGAHRVLAWERSTHELVPLLHELVAERDTQPHPSRGHTP